MDGLLEFIFNVVPNQHLGRLIQELCIKEENIVNIAAHTGCDMNYDEKKVTVNKSIWSNDFWGEFLLIPNNGYYFINLYEIPFVGKYVRDVSLMVHRSKSENIVTVLASSRDCVESGVIKSVDFYAWAQDIATRFSIEDFHGGLDSADRDRSTELYSSNGVGAIKNLSKPE